MKYDWELQIEKGREELREAFVRVAREAGFRVKAAHAWRRVETAQHEILLSRSRTAYGDHWIQFNVRFDRPGDRGDEVLRSWDISTSLNGLFMPGGMLADAANLELYQAATRVNRLESPAEGRGPILERLLKASLPWFDEFGTVEAVERTHYDEEARHRMGGIVMRSFDELRGEL